jgi:hypothetical protein
MISYAQDKCLLSGQEYMKRLTQQRLDNKEAGKCKCTNTDAVNENDKSGFAFGHLFCRLHGLNVLNNG